MKGCLIVCERQVFFSLHRSGRSLCWLPFRVAIVLHFPHSDLGSGAAVPAGLLCSLFACRLAAAFPFITVTHLF